MARFDGKFIKGKIGPVVYKKYREIQVMQRRPDFTLNSQTAETREAAATFGVASNLAMYLRDNLDSAISGFYDGTMIYRLNSEGLHSLRQSLNRETGTFNFLENSFERLNGFEFNKNSLLRENFFVQPDQHLTGNTLQINLPELHIPQDLKFPKDAPICMLSLAVGLYDLTYGHMKLNPVQSADIHYKYRPEFIPPQQFDFEVEPGCLCITVIFLRFVKKTFAGNMIVNNKAFNPVAISKAFMVNGTVDEEHTKAWQDIKFKTT